MKPEEKITAEQEPTPPVVPDRNVELAHVVEKGIEIASSVAYDILELVDSGKLKDEQVELNGLVRTKTNADRISQEIFTERLQQEFPQCHLLSEESRASQLVMPGTVPQGHTHFVLDPIDGTAHLKEGDGEWLINLAAVTDGIGTVGISVAPQKNKLYLGVSGKPSIVMNLDGSERSLACNNNSKDSLVFGICAPIDLGRNEELYNKWQQIARENNATGTKEFGSAYSYLMVATGEIDVFVNPGGNFHWDTVAQQVILEGANCSLVPIDWNEEGIVIRDTPPARYDLDFIKDDGHIAARSDLDIRVDKNHRMIWKPVFD